MATYIDYELHDLEYEELRMTIEVPLRSIPWEVFNEENRWYFGDEFGGRVGPYVTAELACCMADQYKEEWEREREGTDSPAQNL